MFSLPKMPFFSILKILCIYGFVQSLRLTQHGTPNTTSKQLNSKKFKKNVVCSLFIFETMGFLYKNNWEQVGEGLTNYSSLNNAACLRTLLVWI